MPDSGWIIIFPPHGQEGDKTQPVPIKLTKPGKPSALIDTRVIYRGDNLEQLAKLPDQCIDLIYIDEPFNSNRTTGNVGEVFWGETKEKRSFEDRHARTQANIDYMRPRCVELARVLEKTGRRTSGSFAMTTDRV